MKIKEVNQAIVAFLEELTEGNAKVVRVNKQGDGWFGIAEVYEESSFIKSLGLDTRVMDKNTYEVELDKNLEVTGYEKLQAE